MADDPRHPHPLKARPPLGTSMDPNVSPAQRALSRPESRGSHGSGSGARVRILSPPRAGGGVGGGGSCGGSPCRAR